MNNIQKAQSLGHSIWIDYLRRDMLESGELQKLIDQGVAGLTSNPTILEKALSESTSYDAALYSLLGVPKSALEIYEMLALEDIREAADLLRPVYDRTKGRDGYVSLEVNPALAYRTQETVAEAERLFTTLYRPNVLIKIPSTPEGIAAVRQLIARGVNVNCTLLFSRERYREVMEAYIGGLEELAGQGKDIGKVASVASFFVSRVDTAVDARLEGLIRQGKEGLRGLLGKAAVANAKLAYQDFQQTFASPRFAALREKGARVQRPVWASTSTKNPAYSDLLYVEPLIGADSANTMPPATLQAFLEHGKAEPGLERDLDQAERTIKALEEAGISLKEVTDRLLSEGVKAFADSFTKLLENLEGKMAGLRRQQTYYCRPSV